ncbi:MAG: hypothetical protein HKN04_08540 [Rhodothermaceae bacterium]|nr:hypothetical protein [Rhodothermaceae bacterium]
MPTVGIVCLNASGKLELPLYDSFAYIVESEPRSHRAHFQPDFDVASGPIAHLGNKAFQADLDAGRVGGWFANQLFDFSGEGTIYFPVIEPALGDEQWFGEDQDYGARLRLEVLADLRDLLTRLIAHSPERGVYFTTDYQFGPGQPMRRTKYTIDSLLDEGKHVGIRWNCLYHLLSDHL